MAGTDRVGTNLMGLVTAAEQIGFRAQAVKGPYDVLREIPLPAIVHIVNEDHSGHFVVLHQVSQTGVVLADPAAGIVKMKASEFQDIWTGYLLLLEPDHTRPLQNQVVTPKPGQRLFKLLAQSRRVLLEAFLC